jgi:hypothetical protein
VKGITMGYVRYVGRVGALGGGPGCGDGGGVHTGDRVCGAEPFGLGVPVYGPFVIVDKVLALDFVDQFVLVDDGW